MPFPFYSQYTTYPSARPIIPCLICSYYKDCIFPTWPLIGTLKNWGSWGYYWGNKTRRQLLPRDEEEIEVIHEKVTKG